jgi:diketogulonate reductase-like aldo/keto reductase
MEEAVRLVGEPSQEKGRLVCNQVYYSIQERAVEEKLLPWCQAHASTLVAYSPLGQGRILHHPLLKEIARSSGGTPAQVALAFLISRGAISIPKSSSISRAKENVGAMKLKISKEDGVRLNEVFPVRTRRTLPMI